MSRTNRAKVVVVLVLYALVLGSIFASDTRDAMQSAMGSSVLGIPSSAILGAIIAIALLPLVWVVHHAAPIVVQGLRDGRGVTAFGMIAYVFQVGKRYPALRRSQYICLFGCGYFVALCGAWIALTNALL